MVSENIGIAVNSLAKESPSSPLQKDRTGKNILIVEDNQDILKLLKFLMTQEGYAVETADGAKAAMELLYTSTPDVVLMDIRLWTAPTAANGMIGMDGLELTRLIKLAPLSKKVKVVAVSAMDTAGAIQEAYEAGCDGYITKPVDVRTFASNVQQYLDVE
jgi:CheY-like chemotaxis protein